MKPPSLHLPRKAIASSSTAEGFTPWLKRTQPKLNWDWKHLQFIRSKLAKVTRGESKRMMLLMPTQHGKTTQVTIPYPLWRMQREPGLRVAVCSYAGVIAKRFSRGAKEFGRGSGIGGVERDRHRAAPTRS